MLTDITADALTRIKNGYMAKRDQVGVPYSKMTLAICNLLAEEGYVSEAKKDGNKVLVTLRYVGGTGSVVNRRPAISEVKRVSKPGLRVYKGKSKLPHVLNGLGIAIISTPKGIMTDKQARKEGVGGEIVAYVW